MSAGLTDILPYSRVVGQDDFKLALELAYLSPGIGGVLVSGQRGTAKSTTVRAFAKVAFGQLPVTLPINATDDRVVGGWRIDELMQGNAKQQPGLIEEAGESGLLYIDEVNLLEDHLVNIILDVVSTGILTVQREGIDVQKEVRFILVGTMNPEEGGLRPQLLDRFGLMVTVEAEHDPERRRQILEVVLALDEARATGNRNWLDEAQAEDAEHGKRLRQARSLVYDLHFAQDVATACARVAAEFDAAGHRADYVMALAARALAALDNAQEVTPSHVRRVAKLSLQHRRGDIAPGGRTEWTAEDDARIDTILAHS